MLNDPSFANLCKRRIKFSWNVENVGSPFIEDCINVWPSLVEILKTLGNPWSVCKWFIKFSLNIENVGWSLMCVNGLPSLIEMLKTLGNPWYV